MTKLLPVVRPTMLDPPLHVMGSGVGGVSGGDPDGGGVAKENVRSPVGATANLGAVTEAVIERLGD